MTVIWVYVENTTVLKMYTRISCYLTKDETIDKNSVKVGLLT